MPRLCKYTLAALPDPRIKELARLLVERCVGVQPGWQVIVHGNPLARPLLDEVCAVVGRRGAYALLRVRLEHPPNARWIGEVSEDVLAKLTEIERHDYAA